MKKLFISLFFGLGILGLNAQTYCTPQYSTACSLGDDINDVFIGTFADSATGCTSSGYAVLTSDTIDISLATPTSAYLSSSYSQQYFAIWIDWNNDGDFSDSGEHIWSSTSGNGTSGSTTTLMLSSSYATGNYRMRIRSNYSAVITASQSCSSLTWGEAHDYTVNILPVPACPAPTNVALAATDSSVSLSWLSSDSAFVVEYGASGFTPGSGTSVSSTDTFVVIQNLSSNTAYQFYLETNCTAAGNGSSFVVGPYYAKTLCSAFSLSFFEGFENDSTGAFNNPNAPSCWFYTEDPGAFGYGYITSSTFIGAHSGTQFYNLYNSSDSAAEALVSPYISDLVDGDKQIEFWAKNTSSFSDNYLLVGTVSDPNDLSTFELIDSVLIEGNNTWEEHTVYIASALGYNMVDHHLAIVTTNYVTFNTIYLDDIDVGLAPSCLPPTALSVNNVGMDSAFVSWAGTGVTGYYEYGPAGFTYGQGTGTVVTATGASQWLTNLDSSTAYDIYVYQMCADSTISPAIGPVSFSTLSCSLTNLCAFEIELVDSWGDGWNGGEVQIVNTSGAIEATLGSDFNTGLSMTIPVSFCAGNTFNIVVSTAGSYPEEMGINVLKGGSVIASYSPSAQTGFGTVMATFTANCNISCPSLSDVQVLAGKSDATVTFNTNGNTGTFVYTYGPSGFAQATGSSTIITDSTSANTFTLTGLASETCYDLYLYSNCGVDGTSDTLGPIAVCTQQCDAADQCHYVLSMYDSFGDGWNGANIEVTINGLTQSYSVSSAQGDSNIVDLYLCAGSVISISNATAGTWPSEIYWDLTLQSDPTQTFGVTLGNFATGYIGADTADCAVVGCAMPMNVQATNIGSVSATITWNGPASSTYYYEYQQSGVVVPFTGTSSTNSVVLNGLLSNTAHFFKVAQVCGAGDTSLAWHIEFTTDTCSMVSGGTPTASVTNVTATDGQVTFDWSSAGNFTGYSINYGNGSSNAGSGTTDVATYTANGSYTAVLTLYNDCDTLVQNITVFMNGIGLEEIIPLQSLVFYPNPTSGVIQLNAKLNEAGAVEIAIFDAMGQLIASESVITTGTELQKRFDLSNRSAGTYVARITTPSGLVQQTFVVSH